jgi:DNA-binding transcriptional ArsR family regulator
MRRQYFQANELLLQLFVTAMPVPLLQLASSTVSKHLSILRQARLIEGRKEGRCMYYRLPVADASAAVRQAISWVCGVLSNDPTVAGQSRSNREISCRCGETLNERGQ